MNYPYQGQQPQIHDGAFIAPGARVIGRVTVGEGSSVWYNAVLRGDVDTITVGRFTNIQDLTLVHCDSGRPTSIGDRVTVGHSCIIHGCTIEDDVLVGMGSTVMNGARIGRNSLIAAGSLITEGKEFPPGSVIMGRPAKVIRQAEERDLELVRRGSENYRQASAAHKASLSGIPGAE